jgi:NCS1 family nucleobase:cation symporter-1
VIPGFLHKVGTLKSVSETFVVIYNNAWFVSFFSAGLFYWILSSSRSKPDECAAVGDNLLHNPK